MSIDRNLTGFRFVETQFGDTIQSIAARELGDASRWPEIVSYNSLIPPFITDEPSLAVEGVALSGQPIMVPAPVATVDAATNPNATFLADIDLAGGQVQANERGDILLCEGLPNLRQALVHRVVTARSELIYHPQYGSLIKRLIGRVSGPAANILAAEYAKSAVESDPRVKEVSRSTAEVVGDVINVGVQAETITGRVISLNEEI